MKIAYIINGMHNPAGRERVIANKAMFFTEAGHEVTIITTDQKWRPYFYNIPSSVKMVDFGVNYCDYAGKNIIYKIFSFIRKNNLFRKKSTDYFDTNPQDIIITLEERLIPSLLSFKSKSVLIAENHFNKYAALEIDRSAKRSNLQRCVYKIKNEYFIKKYLKQLDAYVVLTQEDKDYWTDELDNLYNIPNSIEYKKDLQSSLDKNIVIAVGRLSYQKGLDRLVSAWKIVSAKNTNWVLHIFGDGEEEEALKQQIVDNGLEKSIKMFPSTTKIQSELLKSSIYVLSSRFEGLPMVLLEAMAVGLPIVSFDCKTGPKDLIDSGYNGFLVKEGNIEELAEKIEILINDEKARRIMGNNAKCSAEKFSHSEVIKEWITLFENLLVNKRNEK